MATKPLREDRLKRELTIEIAFTVNRDGLIVVKMS